MAFLLVLTVLLPMVGSGFLATRTGRPAEESRSIALGFALATLALTSILLLGFRAGVVGPQFAFGGGKVPYGADWMGGRSGVRFALGLDGISVGLFALTSLLAVTAVCCSWDSIRDKASTNYALLLALQSGLLGLFASLDVILFYVFFEFTLIPLFFLIGIFGGVARRRASLTFFLYTLAGSLLTLLGVIALVAIHYTYSPGHVLTFSIPELTTGLANLPWPEWQAAQAFEDGRSIFNQPQVLVFLLLFAGFAAKLALFPLHTWQPLAYSEAPTGGTILLAGAALKVGCYGLLRFNLGMTPIGAEAMAPLMATLATIAIIYGALAALAQHDLKRLIAYSSISHMGFIVLGLFSLNATGIEGATIQMVNHGLTTGALFACVGLIADRYKTRDITELGGLWNRYPIWSFLIIVAALGSAALPGLNGFIGEFPILLGMSRVRPTTTAFATLGMILGAYYLLWMLQRVVFGPLREPTVYGEQVIYDPTRPTIGRAGLGTVELAGIVPLIVMIVVIGVFPAPFVDRIKPPIAPIVEHLKAKPKVVAGLAETRPASTVDPTRPTGE